MRIILSIRNFFGLDKVPADLNNNLVDSVGLLIEEKKDFMKSYENNCWGGVKHETKWYEISLPTDSHLGQDSP